MVIKMKYNLEKAIADYSKEALQMASFKKQSIVDIKNVEVPEPEPTPEFKPAPNRAFVPAPVPEPAPTTASEVEFEDEIVFKDEDIVFEKDFDEDFDESTEKDDFQEAPEKDFDFDFEVDFEEENKTGEETGDVEEISPMTPNSPKEEHEDGMLPGFDEYISRCNRSWERSGGANNHGKRT
ncbi:MAG: hypothetical protein FWH07_02830 [Oscillospiraceae bacterium]|nr:hypothetical protein [Oscillospiraceae bacterium]